MARAAALAALGALALIVPLTAGAAGRDTDRQTFVVLLDAAHRSYAAKAAVKGAGGRVVSIAARSAWPRSVPPTRTS